MDATDGVAIVTGSGGDIGAAIATTLAAAGMPVAIVDRDSDAAERTARAISRTGHVARTWACDVSVSESVTRTVEDIAGALGPPVVLVNNAGIMRDAAVQSMTDDEWHSVIDSHVAGSFAMCRAVVPFMLQARTGRIVMISSRAALGNAYRINYSAAKAAMQGMTRALALELGPHDITVNCVAPGHITTEMTRSMAARAGLTYEQYRDDAVGQSALDRVGSPQDVADAVGYFVSSGAGYTTGQILYVAGRPTV